jgi:hypothetical protein
MSEEGEIVQRFSDIGMALAKRCLVNGERALKEQLGAGKVRPQYTKFTHESQGVGDVWMHASENSLPQCNRTLAEWHGGGVLARIQELLGLIKGRLRLHQLRVHTCILDSRIRRTAQDDHHRPPEHSPHVGPPVHGS